MLDTASQDAAPKTRLYQSDQTTEHIK